jgi:hypothetical protein
LLNLFLNLHQFILHCTCSKIPIHNDICKIPIHNDICVCLSTTDDLEANLPEQIGVPTILCLVVLNGFDERELKLSTPHTAGEVKNMLHFRHPEIDHVKISLSVFPFTRLDEIELVSLGSVYNCKCYSKTGDLTIFVVRHLKS